MKPAAPVTRKVRGLVGSMDLGKVVPRRSRFKSLYGRPTAPNFRSMHAEGSYDARHATSAALVTSRRPELTALTSVRAFAALEVVLLHVLFELGGDGARAVPATVVDLLTSGGLAVTFF